MRKKYIYLLLVCILFTLNICNINATTGALRARSIKTCPNGVTYGYHGSGNGGHWHKAVKSSQSSSGWMAEGKEIKNDPCPNSSGNSNTSNTIQDVVKKSNDTSIQKIIINSDEITEIKDDITYNSIMDSLNITIILKDINAKYEVIGDTSILYANKENNFEIVVTAEDNTKKTYNLHVTRESVETKVKINKLLVNDEEVEFDTNNKGSLFVPNWNEVVKVTYELSDSNAVLKIFKDNEEMTTDLKLKQGFNNYKIIIHDEFGDEKEYSLEIERMSKSGSVLLYIITGLVMLIPIVIIVIIIIRKKRKDK